MKDLQFPEPVKELGLQSCQLVEREIQNLQVDEVDEGCVWQLGDAVRAQVKVLEFIQPLEGILMHVGYLVVIKVEPGELGETEELVWAEIADGVVSKRESEGPFIHTVWGRQEPLRVAVKLQVFTSAFLGAGCA